MGTLYTITPATPDTDTKAVGKEGSTTYVASEVHVSKVVTDKNGLSTTSGILSTGVRTIVADATSRSQVFHWITGGTASPTSGVVQYCSYNQQLGQGKCVREDGDYSTTWVGPLVPVATFPPFPHKNNLPAIFGGVFGGIAFVLVLLGLGFWLLRRRKARRSKAEQEPPLDLLSETAPVFPTSRPSFSNLFSEKDPLRPTSMGSSSSGQICPHCTPASPPASDVGYDWNRYNAGRSSLASTCIHIHQEAQAGPSQSPPAYHS
ncbi:hypothetical protein DL96DRAFT_1728453 [Flagelloscypha sp. PMI_526]|nr:hypothetical protein DL96DRAFT_1728453 [Flagelloscypha sp. PMI_526]